jgi:hypothetical protein
VLGKDFIKMIMMRGKWDVSHLKSLNNNELHALSMVLGISGPNENNYCVEQLVKIRNLRFRLAHYRSDKIFEITDNFGIDELHFMFRVASIPWRPKNKYICADSLIAWRDECRSTGKYYFDEAIRRLNPPEYIVNNLKNICIY